MELSAKKGIIMGILNITPDSFSDGGRFYNHQPPSPQAESAGTIAAAGEVEGPQLNLSHLSDEIKKMIEQGASIIDIGGESTGPGSKEVSAEEELNRVKPVINLIAEKGFLNQVMFSIDSYKANVAEYALKKGFHMVNDVTALRGDRDMVEVLLKYQPHVVLMYAKDNIPRTTTEVVEYQDVMKTVIEFLESRVRLLLDHGFPKDRIILDPGMGAFVSANPKYSFEIIKRLEELKALGYPILIGVSRKSFLGGKLEERDEATVQWSLKALQKGAKIVRVHEVGGVKKALNHLLL